MLALPPRTSNNFPRFSWLPPEAVKKFIIATVCLSATLASNAPAEDKKTHPDSSGRPHLPRGQ